MINLFSEEDNQVWIHRNRRTLSVASLRGCSSVAEFSPSSSRASWTALPKRDASADIGISTVLKPRRSPSDAAFLSA
jgi:hypothetical protein